MRKTPLLPLAALALLAGCGGVLRTSEDRIGGDLERIERAMAQMRADPAPAAGAAVRVSEGVFVAPVEEIRSPAALIPAALQAPDAVSLVSRDPMSLTEIAARLSEITGVPHVAALGPDGEGAAVERGAAPAPAAAGFRPVLRGPLSQVLDEVAGAFGATWTWSEGRVIFRDFVTRRYALAAMPGGRTASSSVGSGDLSSSGEVSIDPWGEIVAAIEGLAGPGARISASPGSGAITVTARPAAHERIAEHVRDVNAIAGRQVVFDVNVLTVSSNDSEGFAVDISAAFDRADGSFGLIGSDSLAGAVGGVNIGLLRGSLDIAATVEALSRQGRVSVETRAGAASTPNRVVPIEVVDTLSYVSSIDITVGSSGIQQQSIQTETLETGFQMQILPRVLNAREIAMQYSIDLSELRGIETFSSDDNTVQLPQVSRTALHQEAILETGQTLVLAGFERQRSRASRSGLGHPANFLLGGRREGAVETVSTVILITPRILEPSGATAGR